MQREVVIYDLDTKLAVNSYTSASMTATDTIKLTKNKHVNFREANTLATFLFRPNTVVRSQSWIMNNVAVWVNGNAVDYTGGSYWSGNSQTGQL